jgi:hypothetical protein
MNELFNGTLGADADQSGRRVARRDLSSKETSIWTQRDRREVLSHNAAVMTGWTA